MFLAALTLYIIVIALHLYFMALEMVLWKKKAPKVFGLSPEFAERTAALASNQGLYNGFLVVALIAGLALPDMAIAHAFMLYGLGCVIIAGIWGAITVNRRIFFVQALPALASLILFWLAR
jgi:putative membrane protein